MKSKKGCFIFTAVVLLLCGLVGLILLGAQFLLQRQERARMEYRPPIVQILEPQDGFSVPAGSHMPVTANIFFTPETPLQRMEVWLDGKLHEKQEAADGADLFSLFHTNLLMPSEGVHVLMVRAVNRLGIIGQSEPITIFGIAKVQDVRLLVPLPEGGDLAGLAAVYETDEATIQKLNPALGGKPPAPGAIIAVPNPPENKPAPAKPAQPLPPPADFQAINPATLPLEPAGQPVWNLNILELKPPDAPSGLQAQVIDCKVKLVWNDNSSFENGYYIWMKGANLPAHIIATLQPSKGGQTWYEFTAPVNGFLMVWVEAFNIVGGQSSYITEVNLDAKCPTSLSSHLQADLLDMSVGANYNLAYCYISLESAPETRLPEKDGNFISIQGGQGNLTVLPHIYTIPIPDDKFLEVSGECWGWAGNALDKLGTFNGKFPMQSWTGVRQELDGGAFKIGLAISSLGAAKIGGTTTYDKFPDPLIPPPFDVKEDQFRSRDPNPPGPELTWQWQSNTWFKGKITGFDIYLNGKLYKSVTDPKARSAPVVPPAGCGETVRWQVAAVAGNTRSILSLPFERGLSPCQAYAVVKFNTLEIPWTGDGLSDGPCDELDFYYHLKLASNFGIVIKEFGYGGSDTRYVDPALGILFPPLALSNLGGGTIYDLIRIKCTTNGNPYTFSILGSYFGEKSFSNPDKLILPIPNENIWIAIGTNFWDVDFEPGNSNDAFGSRLLKHQYPNIEAAQKELGCGKTFRDPPDGYRIEDNADTAVTYTLTVYPNECSKIPVGIPLPELPKK